MPDLKVSVHNVVDIEIIVIITERIDEHLCNSQPAKVEYKFKNSEEGEWKVHDGRRVIADKVHGSGNRRRGVASVFVDLLIFLFTGGVSSKPRRVAAAGLVNFNKECWLQKLTVENPMSSIKVIDDRAMQIIQIDFV